MDLLNQLQLCDLYSMTGTLQYINLKHQYNININLCENDHIKIIDSEQFQNNIYKVLFIDYKGFIYIRSISKNDTENPIIYIDPTLYTYYVLLVNNYLEEYVEDDEEDENEYNIDEDECEIYSLNFDIDTDSNSSEYTFDFDSYSYSDSSQSLIEELIEVDENYDSEEDDINRYVNKNYIEFKKTFNKVIDELNFIINNLH